MTEVTKTVRGAILDGMLSGAINELFQEYQEYYECLLKLDGQEIRLPDNTSQFVVVKRSATEWDLGFEDILYSFRIRFEWDHLEPKHVKATLIAKPHASGTEVLTGTVSTVAYILTTYHPDGRKLDESK